MSVQKDCMILNLVIGAWQGYRLDKKWTREITEAALAAEGAARVNKHVISKEPLKMVNVCIGKIRVHFYGKTLPWKDNGDRLLPRSMVLQFVETHESLVNEYNDAVEEFLTKKYLAAVDQASFWMGAKFNPDDYPDADELRRKFYVHLSIDGVPKTYDLRLDQSEEIFQARVNAALEGLWRKLEKPLEHLSAKLNSEEIFRDSAVENLRAVVEMMPLLNFTDDPGLEALRQEIESRILPFEASDFRKDATTRAQIGAAASEITEKMRAMMMGFGNGEDEE